MYGSHDGYIHEGTLSSILKTALGVTELSVTSLFQAIDQEGTGRITFGEWPWGRGMEGPGEQGCAQEMGTGTPAGALPSMTPRAPCCLLQYEVLGRKILSQAGQGQVTGF